VLGHSTDSASARIRRSRRALAVGLTIVIFAISGGYWLENAGVIGIPIMTADPAVTANGGFKASYTPLTANAAKTSANIQVGNVLAKVATASGRVTSTRVNMAWFDQQPTPVSGNTAAGTSASDKNGVTFQVYLPIHTGACVAGDPAGPTSGPTLSFTDSSTGTVVCAMQDVAATASNGWTDGHTLFLTNVTASGARMILTGWVSVGAGEPTRTCAGTGTTAWCSVTGTSDVLYLIATISKQATNSHLTSTSGATATYHFYGQVRPSF
jgi:hypothetical protein